MSKRIITPYRKKYVVFNASEARRKTKLKCIEYKGGQCKNCGYSKCPTALVFHHPDPAQKDFGISEKGFARSFAKCKPEIEKCILLCANCHAEVHYKEDQKLIEIKRQELEKLKQHSTIA